MSGKKAAEPINKIINGRDVDSKILHDEGAHEAGYLTVMTRP
jgi:hypothetical protein